MNKTELITEVAKATGYTKKDTGVVVDAVTTCITDAMKNGNEVSIAGFGKFIVKDRAARQGVNPSTGEKITIAARKSPAFKPATALKNIIK